MQNLHRIVNTKNEKGLSSMEIPADQNSIAGGFFIAHKSNIDWWCDTFDATLRRYFDNQYLVKDDQIILVDCILSAENAHRFYILQENIPRLDNWFLFQRFLN
jgi:hypothetical protein